MAAQTASAAVSVCPSRTGADSPELALLGVCPFGFAFPLSEGAIPSPAPCPTGPARGAPQQQWGAGGARIRGTPGTGAPEEMKAAEAGDGLEVRRCGCAPLRPRPHRDKQERKGRGGGKAAGGRPSLGLPQRGAGRVRARASEGGQPDRQLLAMNINYFLHRQTCAALTVS